MSADGIILLVILILLAPGIISGITMGLLEGHKDKKSEQKNRPLINIACMYLEDGYNELKKEMYDSYMIYLKPTESGRGFRACILLVDDDRNMSIFKSPIYMKTSKWSLSSDGKYLQQAYYISPEGSWDSFERSVWTEIRKKHPSWRITNNCLFVY